MCIFAPYSKTLIGVNFVHVNGALAFPVGMPAYRVYKCFISHHIKTDFVSYIALVQTDQRFSLFALC